MGVRGVFQASTRERSTGQKRFAGEAEMGECQFALNIEDSVGKAKAKRDQIVVRRKSDFAVMLSR